MIRVSGFESLLRHTKRLQYALSAPEAYAEIGLGRPGFEPPNSALCRRGLRAGLTIVSTACPKGSGRSGGRDRAWPHHQRSSRGAGRMLLARIRQRGEGLPTRSLSSRARVSSRPVNTPAHQGAAGVSLRLACRPPFAFVWSPQRSDPRAARPGHKALADGPGARLPRRAKPEARLSCPMQASPAAKVGCHCPPDHEPRRSARSGSAPGPRRPFPPRFAAARRPRRDHRRES